MLASFIRKIQHFRYVVYSEVENMTSYLSLSALTALLPLLFYVFRFPNGPRFYFWCFLAVAISGSASWTIVMFAEGWQTGFTSALWITITATLLIFFPIAGSYHEGSKLAAGLLPYLFVLGMLSFIWGGQSEGKKLTNASDLWVMSHIIFSLGTYALLTLAAIAGFSAFFQERSLKTKKYTFLNVAFPTLASSENLESRLLELSIFVLSIGLITGITAHFLQTGNFFHLTHKTLLSLGTFGIILTLLVARKVIGLRGIKAARWVLLAFLTLTLAYPGVKFVTDVLLV